MGWNAFIESVGTIPYPMAWTIVGTSKTFNIEYSTNGGSSWTRILSNWYTTTGNFNWQIPNTPSANCLVRVMDALNNAIVDQSNAPFTINRAFPKVVIPNGGENWFAGTTNAITWVQNFVTTGTADLDYSTNNGSTWIPIGSVAEGVFGTSQL